MQNNWDLSLIYKNKDDIQKDVETVRNLLPKYDKIKSKSDFEIDEMLKWLEDISVTISRLMVYCSMKRDEDSTNSDSQKLMLEMEDLYAKVSEVMSSLEPTIMNVDEKIIDEFMKSSKKEDYKKVIKTILRNKPHILSEKEEYIISIAKDIAEDTHNSFYMLTYSDMEFPVVESDKEKRTLTHANYHSMQIDTNRAVRKESFDKMYNTYSKYANTFATNYYGHVKAKEKLAKLRHFDSNLAQELFEDDVDLKIYDTLIDTVSDYIPTLSKYMDIKKKYLGLDEISNYDLYVPILAKDTTKYSYEQAKQIITNAFMPLGKDYIKVLKQGFEDRWIDVYPKKGKRAGAYSSGAYDTNPYILMNYTDELNSVFTLAHELGHSMHSYYSRKNNPYFDYDYTIFVAEVASTTNELLLHDYMLKNAQTQLQKDNLILNNLEQFRTTIFRQTMFAEFEKIVHNEVINGNPMTAQTLNEIYYNLNKKYYPNIKLDDKIAVEWARIPHFYSDFYVYKYATGLISATFLSQKILEGGQNVDRYIEFLKDGSKNYPVIQLKNAGVDIADKNTLSKALDVFKNTVENFK